MSPSQKITTLEALRREAGLTQGQLAQALNVTSASVSGWENGSINLTPGRAEQVFSVLTAYTGGISANTAYTVNYSSYGADVSANTASWAYTLTPADLTRPLVEVVTERATK